MATNPKLLNREQFKAVVDVLGSIAIGGQQLWRVSLSRTLVHTLFTFEVISGTDDDMAVGERCIEQVLNEIGAVVDRELICRALKLLGFEVPSEWSDARWQFWRSCDDAPMDAWLEFIRILTPGESYYLQVAVPNSHEPNLEDLKAWYSVNKWAVPEVDAAQLLVEATIDTGNCWYSPGIIRLVVK